VKQIKNKESLNSDDKATKATTADQSSLEDDEEDI
jgi:hypothetical protein